MATITPTKVAPHTRIENAIITKYTPHIGLSGLGVLVLIKRHLNQKTSQCNPSYATIAEEAGVDRSTIIRHVRKLKAVNLLDPQLRFREDGGYASNQYNFACVPQPPPSRKPDKPLTVTQETPASGREKEPATLVAEENHPSGTTATPPSGSHATSPGAPVPPEQSSLLNKKERTSPDIASLPTEKQKTCPHPLPEIGYLPADNIRICHHCFGLLDDNLKLITEESGVTEAPEPQASAECEVRQLADEPEPKIPPVGEAPTKTAAETPRKMARKSSRIAGDEEKTAGLRRVVVSLGRRMLRACSAS